MKIGAMKQKNEGRNKDQEFKKNHPKKNKHYMDHHGEKWTQRELSRYRGNITHEPEDDDTELSLEDEA